MMVEILTAVLIVCARRPAEAKPMIIETKALLRRYLAPYEVPSRKGSDRTRAAVRSAR
jgi:hypothetical protein